MYYWNDANFMSSIITGVEKWVYAYMSWKQNKCPPSDKRLKKIWQVKSNDMTLLITSFYIVGLVHHEFVLEDILQNSPATLLQCYSHEWWETGFCTMTIKCSQLYQNIRIFDKTQILLYSQTPMILLHGILLAPKT